MKLIATLVLVLLSVNVLPQLYDKDVQDRLEAATDTAKIEILKELCWEYRFSRPADAWRYGLQALTLAKELEIPDEEIIILNYMGVIQRNVGDHATALEYFFNARRLAEEQKNNTQLAYSFNNIGDIYNQEYNSQLAVEYELKALKIFEELGDSGGVSYACHQIARAYVNLDDFEMAIVYDTRAMDIREFQGNRIGVAYSNISIGETYLEMGDYDEALYRLLKSSEIFKGQGEHFGLAASYFSLGMYYRRTGGTKNALEYLTESLELGRETKSPIRIRNAAQVLSEINAEQENFKAAYQMYILYKETYDSLYHEENQVKITQLVMQNEYEQKELLQLAEIARQKQFRNYVIILFGLVVILVFVILNRYYIKRKSNINLQVKNTEIESQKNELNNTLNDLTQAQTHLVQSEKMASLGQLTAGVAHELNNPINFISASIKPLQRNVEDLLGLLDKYEAVIEQRNLSGEFSEVEELKESVDLAYAIKETQNLFKGIVEGSSRSMQIVKDLRTFSRMDENEFKQVDIHEGIDSTLLLLHHKMENKISVVKKYGKISHVECLPGKLNQVFMNILTNSILAIEDKGEISIETSSMENKVKISFKDNGKGMPPEVRDHIFEPFFTTRTVGEGTGLGLSISYSIIEEHQGVIEVYSKPGKGTEFLIILPLNHQ